MSTWRSMKSSVPQGSILGPGLFIIFFSNINSGIDCILSKFVDNTKLSGVVDRLERWDVIQRDLDRLEKWAHVNFMRFSKAKCKVLHMSQGKPQYQCRLGDEGIQSSPAEKDLEVLVDEKLDMSQQWASSPENQPYPGLHQKKHGQKTEGSNSAPLLFLW
ncbi:rna-directed dna polymerase from mobile element jockey-like [Limosa lapponica baueri]|uniref:Rna-directed dna polymerase from mobile element jockey-like n=1 Tax=Limosa lapponica baueri TaxID=1758121 RepID=A0A2I0T1M1_LIMLA|nr:rna-directed dna polymerase from mobile element jockey-like [Limosa lapponica baueri]